MTTSFRVNGVEVPINAVWVHFQDPESRSVSSECLLTMSADDCLVLAKEVELPEIGKGAAARIKEALSGPGLEELDGLLWKLLVIKGVKRKGFSWVIAAVSEIDDSSGDLRIRGRAIPYDPSKY